MKKLVFFFIFFSVVAFGQTSRVDSLGGAISGTDPNFARASIYDPADVIMFPHLSNQYKDFLNVAYFGGDYFNGFGTFGFSDDITIGFADYSSVITVEGIDLDAEHTYSIFGAYGMGNMSLGLFLNYWGDSAETESKDSLAETSGSTTKSVQAFDIGLSLGMILGEKTGFDALLKLRFGSYDDEVYSSAGNPKTILNSESDGILQFVLGGRYFMPLGERAILTAWGFFDYSSEGYFDLDYSAENAKVQTLKHEFSMMTFNIGTSLKITSPNGKMDVTPYIGMQYKSDYDKTSSLTGTDKGTYEETTDGTLVLPFAGISLEYRFKEWLTFFSGYTKYVNFNTTETKEYDKNNDTVVINRTNTEKASDNHSSFAFGFSLHNEDMALQFNMNKEFFTNGPNFISGNTTGGFMASVTFQYNFGYIPVKKAPVAPEQIQKVETKKAETDESEIE
ncbi:hypothetical protein JXR93_10140 [bacterium]|nr:hypothetical protein [bacterium]